VAAHALFGQSRRWAIGLVLAGMTLCLTVDVPAGAVPVVTKDSVPCQRPGHGFKPSEARIPAIGRTVRVVVVERTSTNAMGAGPVSESGKWLMAMDPVTKPGSGRGSVLMSGHVWPDGSALGNAMLAELGSGDRITLVGKYGEQACYGIYKRASYPKDEVPEKEAFRTGGEERLVIVTCSGKRLGPGNWTRRTLWYAKPVVPSRTTPPTSNPPSGDDSSGSLLGGLLGGLFGAS